MTLLEKRGVLIFESSKDMMSLLTGAFTKAGARVMEADCGRDAASIIDGEDPDVVCLDLTRQDSSGWSVLQSIRDSQPYMLARTIALIANPCDRPESELLEDCRTVSVLKPLFAVNLVAQACRALRRPAQSARTWKGAITP